MGIPSERKPKTMFGHAGPMLPGWRLDGVMPEITRRAVAYIDGQAVTSADGRTRAESRRPFFLYFALTAPHTPIVPSEAHRGSSRAGRYGDYVHQVDGAVGRVMEALDRNGLSGNTLLIVTSDNGSPARDGTNDSGPVGSVRRYDHNPSGTWRGLKSDAWEGGHRIPFLVRWPGRVPAGRVSKRLICQVDLMATLASVVGYDLPRGAAEDSLDLLPEWLDRDLPSPIRTSVIHHSGNGMFAVRKGRWKLILGRGSGGFSKPSRIEPGPGEPGGQLYDLVRDPGETRNRYREFPEVVDRLARLLGDK